MQDNSRDSWYMSIPHDDFSLKQAQEDELLFVRPCEKKGFSGYPGEVENSDCFYCSRFETEDCPLNYS